MFKRFIWQKLRASARKFFNNFKKYGTGINVITKIQGRCQALRHIVFVAGEWWNDTDRGKPKY
jgi:hypothetical protein